MEFLNFISLWALPFIILLILTVGLIKKVPLYECFTEGAKDGFKTAVNIIPYLVAIIVAISMLRASGAIEMLSLALGGILEKFHVPTEVLPVIFVRPLSGSAALGLFSDIASNTPMSYATKLAAVMVGSSETTFYVLSVYFGSVGVTRFRYAIWVGIISDILAAVLSIVVCSYMFL